MSTMTHVPPSSVAGKRRWSEFVGTEMWAGLAIVVMWLAVLFDAIFGPEIVTHGAGGDNTSVPSAVAVAFFAFLATWVVARYGFRHERER